MDADENAVLGTWTPERWELMRGDPDNILVRAVDIRQPTHCSAIGACGSFVSTIIQSVIGPEKEV